MLCEVLFLLFEMDALGGGVGKLLLEVGEGPLKISLVTLHKILLKMPAEEGAADSEEYKVDALG